MTADLAVQRTGAVQGTGAGPRSGLGLADLPADVEPVLAAVQERAGAVDRGEADLWEALRDLGDLGLLAAPLPVALELTHALARRCTPTAFSLWGHRASLTFHDATGAPRPEGSEDGTVPLASGMAPAFKEEAGLGEIPLVAAELPGGALSVSGTLPWCSNLRPGALVTTPVRGEGGHRAIVRIRRDAEGVQVVPLAGLTSLEGTSSGVLRLEDVRVPAEDVLTDNLQEFRARVRAPFLLIQTAMCLGLAQAARESAEAAADDTARRVLAGELEQAAREEERLRAELVRLSEQSTAPWSSGPASPRDLVAVRLGAALLAGSATRLEQKLVGGRGFALASATSRRAREAAFLPVQSPTEIHLRHLLSAGGPA